MSYIAGRFDYNNELSLDKELVELYRKRENDSLFTKPENKGLNVRLHNMFNQDSKILELMPMFGSIFFKPNDKYWESMSEEERIENGLITKYFYNYFVSPVSIIFVGVFATFGFSNYSKIWRPSGIILRNQRIENWSKYLWRRLPVFVLPFYVFYSSKIYQLNYIIDFYSPEEDMKDKKINLS